MAGLNKAAMVVTFGTTSRWNSISLDVRSSFNVAMPVVYPPGRAGERTVKNWFAGTSGPSGKHLARLIQNSDETLAIFLVLSGRKELLAASRIVDIRNKLAEAVEEVDQLLEATEHK